jgi:hypothetical protein
MTALQDLELAGHVLDDAGTEALAGSDTAALQIRMAYPHLPSHWNL